ncbi:hypothetical protein [Deinococcus daejeonensis]|uniref:Uncharacterized protein n=1 Tax=Deinococcus daejeonensis TaxID=1007098 RepID=A0ABQ2J0W0_9DEIO|nr:hypothetical protein [Deinococcus daejeonensis]GGN37133.1 hypothetical protein GCM10010842_18680 [Deinococcus daejeonensis]
MTTLTLLRRALLPLALLGGAHAATLDLKVGQTGRLGDATVTLLRAQDSRCPMNARCIQAGDLITSVLVRQGSRVRLLRLKLSNTTAQSAGLRISGATASMAGQRLPLTVTFSDGH